MDRPDTWRQALAGELNRFYFGRPQTLELILVALLCSGHVLIEDIPGVGKTLLAKGLARLLGARWRRIQGTPDLSPPDIVGYSLFNPQTGALEDRPGPVFTQLLLVDEINRAGPRAQAALLEAMAEGRVTRDGRTRRLPDPFFVLATQNPIEFEGTFPLPEAQKDRFFLSLDLGYPNADQEAQIWRLADDPLPAKAGPEVLAALAQWKTLLPTVRVAPRLETYLRDLVEASRRDANLEWGLSPRASRFLHLGARARALLQGRDFVTPDDLKALWLPVGAHRVVLKPQARLRGQTSAAVLTALWESLPTPVLAGGGEA